MEETLQPEDQILPKKTKATVPNHALRRERELLGWSQTMVAEKIGCQPTLVNRWENGYAFPSPYYREKLCQLFGKDAEALGLIKSGSTPLPSDPIVVSAPSNDDNVIITGAPPETPRPTFPQRQGVSRRALVLAGLGGTAVVVGAGALWWSTAHSVPGPTVVTPTITKEYVYRPVSDTYVNGVYWSPRGNSILCPDGDHTVQALNAANGVVRVTYRGHQGNVNFAAWSPDATRAASASSDKTVQVWDATNATHLFTYSGHNATVLCVNWSPDGSMIASGGKDHAVHVWDPTTGALISKYTGHTQDIYSVTWSPDGKSIASCGPDGTVQVCSAFNGQPSTDFAYQGPHNSTVYEVTWSPDGTKIVSTSGDSTVTLWDAVSGNHMLTYTGHIGSVYTARWSPNGKYIASGGDDKTIRIWNASTGKTLQTYTNFTDRVNEISWSPDGKHVAASSEDHTMDVCRVTLP